MEITQDQLVIEAGQLALEVRLKDRAINALEQERLVLRQRVAELEAELAGRPQEAPPPAGTAEGN